MLKKQKQERLQRIYQAAYELIKTRGYASTSMLMIAKRAKASNETLYRWFGNKQGLIISMIEANAILVKEELEEALSQNKMGWDVLKLIAPILLKMVLSEQAILLNRAAACDASDELGLLIEQHGREVIMPLINQLFDQLGKETTKSSEELAATFKDLLIGDLQIRRAIGALEPLSQNEIDARVKRAITHMKILL